MSDSAYKRWLLGLLLMILMSNYLDRAVIGLALQDIKTEFSLSDTQVGLLTGLAFAIFFCLLSIPVARWADRGDRVRIISLTALIWSVAAMLGGAVTNFMQLLLVRMMAAVGEAGCVPPAQSLISDNFNRGERPRALAVYTMGGALSVVVGYFVAGWLNEFYGWRVTFVVLGIPGVLLALLSWFVLREPRRRLARASDTSLSSVDRVGDEDIVPLREVFRTLWCTKTFRHLVISYSIVSLFAFGITQWQPTFFIRSFGLKTGELGTWMAVIVGLGSLIGTVLGGELASRYAAYNEELQLKVVAAVYCGFGLLSPFIYLSPNKYWAFGLMALVSIGGATTGAPLFATIQTLLPSRMRAVALATMNLFSNLIGMGLGPLAAGALSDLLRPWAGDDSLRYALLAMCPGYVWGAWHLWRASKTVSREISELEGPGCGGA